MSKESVQPQTEPGERTLIHVFLCALERVVGEDAQSERHGRKATDCEWMHTMKGWRARIGFLVPPGNPTLEPEMMELAPEGVSLHFTRMAGTHTGQEERNLSQVASVPDCVKLLAIAGAGDIAIA